MYVCMYVCMAVYMDGWNLKGVHTVFVDRWSGEQTVRQVFTPMSVQASRHASVLMSRGFTSLYVARQAHEHEC